MQTHPHGTILKHTGRLVVALIAVSLQSAVAAIGEFEANTDVGNPARTGAAAYDAASDTYTVSGSGKNIWFDKDEFHYVWRKLKGDFIIQTRAHLVGKGVELHRKLGLMVRTSLDTSSPQINAVVHGDGLTSLQFRRTTGATTEQMKSTLTAADVIQLERRGDKYLMSVARFGEPFITSEITNLDLGDEVHVGLFVCAHNTNVIEEAVFQDVRLTIPAATNFVPYHDYLGSRLEVLDVDSGRRQVLLRTADDIEAPNWTPDGATLIYNSRGRLFHFPLATRQPVPLDTGFADHCNNDHVLSFDGKTLGISHQAKGSKSTVYTLPVTGGTPAQITENSPSYLHGFSPGGKFLIYTGQRNGDFDIYRLPVTGGAETRLTTAKGLDDGSEYSPDGKYIYFNSARTGTMQIWRMLADGSGQEQLTHGEFNDWFPHVSPDGKRIVFISFSKEVPAEQHPYYQHVYLRDMPTTGGEPKVVAYLYGGQGTINVPSWSPDSRRVAFVSHTGNAN